MSTAPMAAGTTPGAAGWPLDADTSAEAIAREAARVIATEAHDERIVVLGEMHGTHEAPALAAELVRLRATREDGATGKEVTLALEVHASEQARIDAFIESSGDAASRDALLSGPFWSVPRERSDGRRSVAMLALLESVRAFRASGADVRVPAFDVGSGGAGANVRNARMAAALREALKRDPQRDFVVLIGEYHARRAAPTSVRGLAPGQAPPVPTMAHLADVPMRRINVSAEQGEFWGCIADACRAWPLGGQRAAPMAGDATRNEADAQATAPTYRRLPGDAARYDAQLVLPRLSVAEPVVVERAAGS